MLALRAARGSVEEVVEVAEPALDALGWRDEQLLVVVAPGDSSGDVLDVPERGAGGHFELRRERARRGGVAAESVGHALPGGRVGLAHARWFAVER